MDRTGAVGQPSADPSRTALTTKAPYVAVETPPVQLPDGYVPVGLELVCRHGSRAIAKLRTARAVDALLTRAETSGGLTPAGRDVARALRRYLDVAEDIGEGQLTDRGRAELRGLAGRMAARLPTLFAVPTSDVESRDVDALSAPKQRTRDSADACVSALAAASHRPPPEIRTDTALLYFHKSDERYQHYLEHDARLRATLAAARDRPQTRSATRTLLAALLTPSFVDEVAAGRHGDVSPDETAAAAAIFAVWQAAAGSQPVGEPSALDAHLPLAALEWFGFLDDLETFYEKGPAFAGDDITFGMARVLLDDMIRSAETRLHDDRAPVARLRFTHAEEILPLATLLQVPGADRPVREGEEYTYATNPFRAADLSPMAANIQWEIYSNGTTPLVRMLVNEQPTRFAIELQPFDETARLYRLSDVERHYRTSG